MRDWPSLIVRFPADGDETLTDLVSASLDATVVAAIEERSPAEWLISFREAEARDGAAAELQTAWAGRGVRVESVDVSDGDWARRSQASLGAIRAGRFLVVPPWHESPAPADADTIRLVIEPSMGFGSGHHATTRLCLQALQTLPVSGARVLDIGTGSGILAIAAFRLGAASVLGVDNDPDALDSACADASINGIEHGVEFACMDFRAGTLTPADTVLANLTGSMLAANASALVACTAPGGHLILSGITLAEAQMVMDVFAPLTTLISRSDEDGWVGLLLGARGPGLGIRDS
jgi:ribosomal protein L11 methyltransferase